MGKDAIILVFPKIMPESKGSDQWTLLPLSLLSIASPLIDAGYTVRLIDQRISIDWRKELSDALKSLKPVCVGVSAMTGYPIYGALACAELVKSVSPETPVVWGGVHPSLLPEQTLQSGLVDIVVKGEGEKTFLALVQALGDSRRLDGIPGVYISNGKGVVGSAPECFLDMDTLPRPAYQLVDIEKYSNAPFLTSKKPVAFATSRGCPKRCRYCYNLVFNQQCWRAKSAGRVIEDIEFLKDEYDIDSLFLLDDNFFVDQNRVNDICHTILTKNLEVTFLNANCRIDTVERYSLDTLDLLKVAGFDRLFIGVESGSDEVLKRIQKDITRTQIEAANKKLKKAGIIPVYSFMAGFPGERIEDVKATLELMVTLLRDYPSALVNPLNIYSPFPGTPLLDECYEKGMPKVGSLQEWADFDYVKINYKTGFPRKDLRFIEKAFLTSNLLDPKLFRSTSAARTLLKRSYSATLRNRIRLGVYFAPELRLLSGKSDISA